MRPSVSRSAPVAVQLLAALLFVAACGGGSTGGGGGGGGTSRVGTINGRLAAPPTGAGVGGLRLPWAAPTRPGAMSLDQVKIELLGVDTSGPSPVQTVVATATPDTAGAFSFTDVKEGQYALRVNQPEFASVAYGVDSTELRIADKQLLSVVLPIITTVVHGFVDPTIPASAAPSLLPPIALDRSTGEVVLVTPAGLAIVDPDKGTVDALRSQSLFDGVGRIVLPPTRGLIWILYGDRIVRVDRSVFTNPDASETLDLEEVAVRATVGEKVRYRLLPAPAGYSSISFTGQHHFSPDEQVLFASSVNAALAGVDGSVVVLDLAQLRILDTVPGRLAGYNPASNQLFLEARASGSRTVTVSVVDATTRVDVMTPVTVENFMGLAPFHASTRTLLLGSQLNTSNVEIPFVTVVDRSATDGSGLVATPWTRAKDWLGVATDPAAAPPAFDAAGQYLTIGDAAFRLLSPSGFQEVTGGTPPGGLFMQPFQGCVRERPVDTTHLYRLWFGCSTTAPSVGFVSLDKANVPIAVRPGVDTLAYLVDEARGRVVFRGDRQLVLVHYADPTATARAEKLDLSSVVAPWITPGAACSPSIPCAADELCFAPTYTSGSGRCVPNPRLPYRPLCGGFEDLACDAGFTCTYVNASRHQMGGRCVGAPARDYATNGPACGAGSACPAGMACAGGRCAPVSCLRDADCTVAGEICGLVQNLGRVCLAPGALPDGAHCLASTECAHGACVPVESGRAQWSGFGGDAVGAAFGTRGLMACTTPCFAQSACGAGSVCTYGGTGNGDSEESAPGWASHRIALAPYCSPPNVPPTMTGCSATCSATQLCQVGGMGTGCRLGYSPEAVTATGTSCLAPAIPNPSLIGCAFRCERSGDCPWATTCSRGVCGAPDCGGATCGPSESCVRLDDGWTSFTCAPVESCWTQADCSAGTCSHEGCFTGTCSTNSDCGAGNECARYTDYAGVHTSYCLPAVCGCSGADAPGAFCDLTTRKCPVKGWCTFIPCDGSAAQCPAGGPDDFPMTCACPSCSWDAADCGGSPIPLCPAGYTCSNFGHSPIVSPSIGAECVPP